MSVMETAESKARIRRSNCSNLELDILTSKVCGNHQYLFGKLSASVTSTGKKKIWQEIASKLSANSSTRRDSEEIRKKWTDLRSQVKKKEMGRRREMKKTGGGPCPPALTDMEQRVAGIIPDCQLDGIDGGLETSISQTASEVHSVGETNSPPEGDTGNPAVVPIETADCEAAIIHTVAESTPIAFHRPADSRKRKVQSGSSCSCSDTDMGRIISLEEKKLGMLTELVKVMKERNEIEKQKIHLKKLDLGINATLCNEVRPVIEL